MDYFSVFFVNRGYLLSLDISVAVQNVQRLQQAVNAETGVRIQDQVLLVANGQTLDANKQVSDYNGIGTENNPVYLFDRRFLRDRDEMSSSQDLKQLQHRIDEAIEHARRTEETRDPHQVYLDLPDRARDCKSAAQAAVAMCARLVQEHALLNNGWLALVCNMDDSVLRMKNRAQRFQRNHEKVVNLRSKATQLLQDFDVCLAQLRGITLPVSLLVGVGKNEEMSLLDWITSSDPNYSLQDLVDQVKEQFEKVDEWDSKRVGVELDRVYEQSRNDDYREIKGINMRLNQLDSSLTKAAEYQKTITDGVNSVVTTPSRVDPEILQQLMVKHRQSMQNVYDDLRTLQKTSDTFHKSKTELLTNIRTRLNGWIVQAYEKLHTAHTEIVVFEEKFLGLKQRIELVTQIKEAPVIYATAVTEIIRRNAFQKEFTTWHHFHSDKCGKFATSEDEIRRDFAKKLEKHFLKCLFPGMFDALPQFYVPALPKFDQTMPAVDANYLRSLRKSVSTLEPFLRVSSPQVLFRLSVKDPSLPSPSVVAPMRREDSFFTADPVNNMATLHKNFPSGMWLAGEDTMDMSPSAIPAMLAKSPPSHFGQSSSVHIQTAPSLPLLEMEAEEDEAHTLLSEISPQSAPIQIPIGMPTSARQMSQKSSQFSTPDDHFNEKDDQKEQFPIEGISQRSLTLEQLKPVAAELLKMKQDLDEIKSEMLLSRDQMEKDFATVPEFACNKMQQAVMAERTKQELVITDLKEQLECLQRSYSEKEVLAEEKAAFGDSLQEKIVELEASVLEKDEKIKILEEAATQHETLIKEKRNEVFKQLTIEYELARDDLHSRHDRIVEEKEEKLRHLQKDMERKNVEIERLKADPSSEEYRTSIKNEIRAELEKEFKTKIDLITRGLERKSEDTVARSKKDIEFDVKKTVLELQHKVKWLTKERDRLRTAVGECAGEEEGRERTESVAKEIEELAVKEAEEIHMSSSYGTMERASHSTQTESVGMPNLPTTEMTREPHSLPTMLDQSAQLLQSTMEASVMPMAASQFFLESNHPSSDDFTRVQSPDNFPAEGSPDSPSLSVACQTRLMMKNVELMVAIQDIGEGSTVLVLFDDRYSAFVLFCNSPFIHFVKESSVRRLGLSTAAGVRRNWILAKVSHVDLCVIRKPDNRYRLPVDARVYRVDVESVPFEAGGRYRSSTVAST